MHLHEYQAKRLIASFGLPVPTGVLVRSVEEAKRVVQTLQGDNWVVKAQVHAGGRFKAGGVKIVSQKEALLEVVPDLLNTRLVTHQTGPEGQPVNALLVEEACDIAKELYLGVVIDRRAQKVVVMASTEGGVEIESVAQKSPEKILKVAIDPFLGVMPYQCRELAFGLGLKGSEQIKTFTNIVLGLLKMFLSSDLSLAEINPLIITQEGKLLCLDAKINVDDNALYRQMRLRDMHDKSQEDDRELEAKAWDLSFIALEGNIGCMVNGAGLAMATMDMIQLEGGSPANFLDVGGSATKARVTEAFKLILSDNQVKGVLVNIFGGIVRCDLIAEGIMSAIKEVGIKVPVVVRLQGNRAEKAKQLLEKSGLNILAANGLKEAAQLAVKMVNQTNSPSPSRSKGGEA